MAILDDHRSPLGTPVTDGPPRDRSPAAARRDELAAFLRSRRERLTPDDVGLPRRRPPPHAGPAPRGGRPARRGRGHLVHLARAGPRHRAVAAGARRDRPHPAARPARAHPPVPAGRRRRPDATSTAVTPCPTRSSRCSTSWSRSPPRSCNGRYDLLAYNRTYSALIGGRSTRSRPTTATRCGGCSPTLRSAPRMRRLGARPPAAGRLVPRLDGQAPGRAGLEVLPRPDARAAPPSSPRSGSATRSGPSSGCPSGCFSPRGRAAALESTSLWLAENVGIRLVTYTPSNDETRRRLEALYADATAPAVDRVTA